MQTGFLLNACIVKQCSELCNKVVFTWLWNCKVKWGKAQENLQGWWKTAGFWWVMLVGQLFSAHSLDKIVRPSWKIKCVNEGHIFHGMNLQVHAHSNHLYIISLWTCRRTCPAFPLSPYLSRSSLSVFHFPAQSSGQVMPFGKGITEIWACPQLQLQAVSPYFRNSPSGGITCHLLLLVAEHLKVQGWKIPSHCRSLQIVNTKLATSSLRMASQLC